MKPTKAQPARCLHVKPRTASLPDHRRGRRAHGAAAPPAPPRRGTAHAQQGGREAVRRAGGAAPRRGGLGGVRPGGMTAELQAASGGLEAVSGRRRGEAGRGEAAHRGVGVGREERPEAGRVGAGGAAG